MLATMLCTVINASTSREIGDGLTYDCGDLPVQLGSLVRVPFRRATVEGVVIALDPPAPPGIALKRVAEILSPLPLLSSTQIGLARWMAREYRCGLRQALQVFLPPEPWVQVLPKVRVSYALEPSGVTADLRRAPAQAKALQFIAEHERVSIEELGRNGIMPAILRALNAKGFIREERQTDAAITSSQPDIRTVPTLTAAQGAALESIQAAGKPSVLFGVTGSGKTEVYACAAADVIRAGKQVIVLVPEILLTEHLLGRFRTLLPESQLAVVHSRLTPAARRETWRRIWSGEVRLVVGSRSALFAPVRELGLVVMDEEHEWTYKNEQTPRYHARETAEELCRLAGAGFIMGSATPSLEAWSRTESGRYHLARLPDRFDSLPLPEVRIIDLAQADFGELFPFTALLVDEMKATLAAGEQAILFLNRRGMASAVLCLQCRRRLVSASSGLPFTMHHDGGGAPYLLDHVSGLQAPLPAQCPSCGSTRLHPIGAGTQRLETIVQKILPKARLLRADRDTLKNPEDIRTLLRTMESGGADILIGTQSVVKGLDLPGVTLAAVLVADVGLSLPTFRAGERVFQLLTQLAGRSGRRKPGRVVIQTFRPEAMEVMLAAKHDAEAYLQQEMAVRRDLSYPPFTRMVRLLVAGPSADKRAKQLKIAIDVALRDLNQVGIATAAPTFYGNGRDWHVLLRTADPTPLLDRLDLQDVSVDVDPIDCL